MRVKLLIEKYIENDMIYAVSTWHVSLIYVKEEKPDSSLLYLNTFRPEDNLFINLDRAEEMKEILLK